MKTTSDQGIVKFAEPVMTVKLPSHALTGKTRLLYTLDNSSVSKAANLRCHMCVPIAMAWSVCQQAWTMTDAFAPSTQLVNILLSCKDILQSQYKPNSLSSGQ